RANPSEEELEARRPSEEALRRAFLLVLPAEERESLYEVYQEGVSLAERARRNGTHRGTELRRLRRTREAVKPLLLAALAGGAPGAGAECLRPVPPHGGTQLPPAPAVRPARRLRGLLLPQAKPAGPARLHPRPPRAALRDHGRVFVPHTLRGTGEFRPRRTHD